MKKFAWIFLFALIQISGLQAQESNTTTSSPVPIDPVTKLITYEGVVEVKGVPATNLHKRTLEWFNTNYKNPTDVIRENDEAGNKVVGKHRFKVNNPPDKQGVKGDGGLVQYSITISCRDGRFKYEITEFGWKQLSVYPCERWLETTAVGYQPAYNDYLMQLDQEMKELIANLKDFISHEKPVKNKDNW